MEQLKYFLFIWIGLFMALPLAGILLGYVCCCFIKLEIICIDIPFIFLRVYLCISAFLAFFISIDK